MEQKRLIWIASAVGIFLLLVIGGAIVLNSSTQKNEPVVTSIPLSNEAWAKPQNTPEQVAELNVRAATANVYSDSVTTFTLNPAGNEITTVTEPPAQTTPQPPAAPVVQTPPASTPTPVITVTQPKQNTVKPAETATAPVAAKPAEKPVSKPAAKVTVTEYWIQAAAPTEKKFAEQARERLSQNKISSDIFTTQKDGKTYYRVRVGPYKTKTEAEYWLGLVKEDPAFTSSYITEVKAQR